MRGRSNNISVLEGRWNHTCSNKTANMGHVDNQVRTNKIGNLSHASIIDQAAVRASACDEAFRAVHQGICFESIVVDYASLKVDSIGEGFEVGRYSRDPKQM